MSMSIGTSTKDILSESQIVIGLSGGGIEGVIH